ncbi:MAG: Archaeal Lon protease [Candidatus Methanocomedens sp.]|nr:MAG: Archaeal Lon protease [ANME-2 cluster archaeon]
MSAVNFGCTRIFTALFLILILAAPVSAINLEEAVTIPLVAAYASFEGETGVLLNATVLVTEGNGYVFVDTQPYTEVDMQGSARMAALVASDVTGIDPSKHDFYFIIEVTSPIIAGPSAGAALTVAAIADIKELPLKEGVVITGMINPDGSIGPVGGIPYKLDAAAQHGATLFIVPEGQTNVFVTESKVDHEGAFVTIEEETIEVDVVKRGRAQGVEVVEAVNIEEAVELLTGYVIEVPEPTKGVWSAEYLDTLRPLSREVLNEANLMYLGAQNVSPRFNSTLELQREMLDNGQEEYDKEQYYAATNIGLMVLKNLKFIQWWDEYERSDNNESYLNDLFMNVSGEINESRLELERFKQEGIMDVDSIGAAEIRVVMAEQFLDDARSSESDVGCIESLAWASIRADTVHWWLSLVNTEHITSDAALKERAGWYVGTASSVVTYAQTIITESQSLHGLLGLLNEADDSLERARIEYDRGYYSGAIFDSSLAIVQASTAISLMGYADIDTKIERSANAAIIAIEEARDAGIEPILAVSAYEFADSLESPSQQIVEYNYARVLAKTTVQLTMYSNMSSEVAAGTPIPLKTICPTPTSTSQLPFGDGLEVPGFSIIAGLLLVFAVAVLLRRSVL